MAHPRFYCSSRKSRRVPVLGALRGERVRCVENASLPPIFRSHNMGLCDADRTGRGRGSKSRGGRGSCGIGLRTSRKITKNGKNALKVSCKFRTEK